MNARTIRAREWATAVAILGVALLSLALVARTAPLYGEVSPYVLQAAVVPSIVVSLTNTDRIQNGLTPLTENPVLARAAQLKADDMAAKSYFDHISPDGKAPVDWLKDVGYSYRNAGENLGLNYNESERVEAGWMNSPGHRANILRPQFTEIGVAVAYGEYKGFPAVFTVEVFATPYVKPVTPVTPVIQKVVKSLTVTPVVAKTIVPVKSSTTTSATTSPSASVAVLEALPQKLITPIIASFASTTIPVATTSAIEAFHRTFDISAPVVLVGTTTISSEASVPSLHKTYFARIYDDLRDISLTTVDWITYILRK